MAGASLVVPHVSQSFTDTSQTPPNGNVEAPINISGDDQWKEGSLGVGTDSFPAGTLDVGGNLRVRSGEGIVITDDVLVQNADEGNGDLLTNLLVSDKSCSSGEAIVGISNSEPQCGTVGGGSTPSLDVVLSEGNTSGGTNIKMTGDSRINMTNSRIVNVKDPQNPQDVATKSYVDDQSGGGGTSAVDWSSPINFYFDRSNTTDARIVGKGGNIDLNLTFPDPDRYQEEQVRGKNGTFKLLIKGERLYPQIVLSADHFARCNISVSRESGPRDRARALISYDYEEASDYSYFDGKNVWKLVIAESGGKIMCFPYLNTNSNFP